VLHHASKCKTIEKAWYYSGFFVKSRWLDMCPLGPLGAFKTLVDPNPSLSVHKAGCGVAYCFTWAYHSISRPLDQFKAPI
jgi:hypothetical protein